MKRYLVVEIKGTMLDVANAEEAIYNSVPDAYVKYWGCDGCGCPTREYSPCEQQPCEDELCGCDCESCGCSLLEAEEDVGRPTW